VTGVLQPTTAEEPVDQSPWEWVVVGHYSTDPVVDSDCASTLEAACKQVEDVLAEDDDAVFGMVTGPGAVTERGYRTRNGGVLWMADRSRSLTQRPETMRKEGE
jgi:hypothetical protein